MYIPSAGSQVPTPDITQSLTIDKTLSKTTLTTFDVSKTIGYDYTDDQGWNTIKEAVPNVEHNDGLESWSTSSTFGNPANSII